MNRIDRLVAILIYMQGRRVTRAEDIADEFATSIRTVYRDIAALAEAGVPIVGEAGVGYSIIKAYLKQTSFLHVSLHVLEEFSQLTHGPRASKKPEGGEFVMAVLTEAFPA